MTRFLVKMVDQNRQMTAVNVMAKSAEEAERVALVESPRFVVARAIVHRFQ